MGISLKKIANNRILRHVVFWIAIVVFLSIPYCTKGGMCFQYSMETLLLVPAWIFFVYILIYLLIPKFLIKKKYFAFFILFILSTAVTMMMWRMIQFYISQEIFYADSEERWEFWSFLYFFYGLISVYVVAGIAATIKLVRQALKTNKQNQLLVQEKLEAELKLLKSQIHPHFLFNTLNNLYALALDNSEKSAEGILKLSGLLHYMLYDCNAPLVLLKKEIKLIEDYISLEKLRYSKRLKVQFDIVGTTDNKMIPPMIILPFVENAFKHGTSKHLQKARINITLNTENQKLILIVENSKSSGISNDESGYEEGIGLNNVSRRLELLYPGNHTLNIKDDDDKFTVYLEIDYNETF